MRSVSRLRDKSDPTGIEFGLFTALIRPVTAEMDPSPVGTASTMNFTDNFSLIGNPARGSRYYRVKVVQ